jgi:hypothetical protein
VLWKTDAPDWARPESDWVSETPPRKNGRMGNTENQRVSQRSERRNDNGDDKTGGGAEPDKAVRIARYGGSEQLQYEEAPLPESAGATSSRESATRA